MPGEFKRDNPHEENMKISVEKILGTNAILKRGKKTVEDHKKALFLQAIDMLINVDFRCKELDLNHFMDMSKYDSAFYEIINSLLQMLFNKRQQGIINFYLYERINANGDFVELVDSKDNPLDLGTPEKLYNVIKMYEDERRP